MRTELIQAQFGPATAASSTTATATNSVPANTETKEEGEAGIDTDDIKQVYTPAIPFTKFIKFKRKFKY